MFKRKGTRTMRLVLLFLATCGFTILVSEPEAPARGSEIPQKKKPKGEYDPPDAFVPSAEQLQQIQRKTAQLAAKIAELRKDKKNHELLPDVEIFLRGAENIVRFKEYYSKDSGKWTLDVLDRGLQRAEQLAKGETPWTQLATRNVLRAYRSNIDGTAQPYGVTYPNDYGKDPKKKWRVDIVLHGRNASLTEVAFINSHNGKKKVSPEQDWVQIDIFGRGNNAYRWAGETDVFEVIDAYFIGEANANRAFGPDLHPIVLRGFSMGGAGTWHLGLRHPYQWRVMGPGAGFTTTHGYAGKLVPDKLPDYQEKCLRIYDAIDYAENARMIPIVAFSGGDDPQKRAADNIENRLKELKIDGMTHLVKPGVGHKFEPDSFSRCNALWSKFAAKGRGEPAKKVSFVTYTTKACVCEWIFIHALEKHYEKASIDAEITVQGARVKTTNVRKLAVMDTRVGSMFIDPTPRAPFVVQIDGQEIKAEPRFMLGLSVLLEKRDGQWRGLDRIEFFENRDSTKRPRLQGPIDDAFTQAFVCVLGSGDTWHPATQKFLDAKVKAFKYDWAKHWRGELPTTGDYAVTPNDIKDKNLILFGDPSSNLTLAQIIDKLPLKWTKDEIEFAGQKYKASEHVPVMIFPNPLNPSRYVVLNTGHTWPSEDYAKTNAMLYPRLGDYAILRMDGSVATAGLFDEYWKVVK
jgi:predicted esterase